MATQNELSFLKTLGYYTGGFFDVFRLAGPANARYRVHVMSELHGVKVPQSKAGITTIREELFRITNPLGDCLAVREENAGRIAKELIA